MTMHEPAHSLEASEPVVPASELVKPSASAQTLMGQPLDQQIPEPRLAPHPQQPSVPTGSDVLPSAQQSPVQSGAILGSGDSQQQEDQMADTNTNGAALWASAAAVPSENENALDTTQSSAAQQPQAQSQNSQGPNENPAQGWPDLGLSQAAPESAAGSEGFTGADMSDPQAPSQNQYQDPSQLQGQFQGQGQGMGGGSW
jgi:hypothetical protein